MTFNIGIIGYGSQPFDKVQAAELLDRALEQVLADHPIAREVWVVSGMTALGIPPLAYAAAALRGWQTFAIGCSKALRYECCDVDKRQVSGSSWQEWLPAFLQECNVLVVIGGGKQSAAVASAFEKQGGKIYRYNLTSTARCLNTVA